MDDSTRRALLAELQQEMVALLAWLEQTEDLELERAEHAARERMLAMGARLLEAGLAARGTGKADSRAPCACGGVATFEGYRSKDVQTLVGWLRLRRAYYVCPGCGHGGCPLDVRLGLQRDSHSPGVRRLAARFGALLPFAPAAATLADAAGICLSASTVRSVTEALGARREAQIVAQVAAAWTAGVARATAAPPDRLYVAMDGVRILGTDGAGREAKVGVVVPVGRTPGGERRAAASYAASFEPAEAFGRRLALEAHRRGLERAAESAVLGDGAAWIWNLAAEHFPGAVQIVDWFHASERIWELGRALHGEGAPETTRWVERQLGRLAHGEATALAGEWRSLPCRGEAATVRDEQVIYFTNQADRMAYDRYRAAGWDIGSGMVESACKYLIGAREKGPGMRWSEPGANHVAQVRVALFNDQWDDALAAA
ncbi:MAG TPA: ISKra4 family transposase [Thermomicrobiaceae bacterium]|nr:ISKra4 family transposase [Thermomicrobiaceae bacterium]